MTEKLPNATRQRALSKRLKSAAERFARSRLQYQQDRAGDCWAVIAQLESGAITRQRFDYGVNLCDRAKLLTDDLGPKKKTRPRVLVKRLAKLMLGRNRLRLNRVVFSRNSGELLTWCEYDGESIGRIYDSDFIFTAGSSVAEDDDLHAGLLELLAKLEDNPDDAIAYFGRRIGLCPYCGIQVLNQKHREQFGAHPVCRPFKNGSTTRRKKRQER